MLRLKKDHSTSRESRSSRKSRSSTHSVRESSSRRASSKSLSQRSVNGSRSSLPPLPTASELFLATLPKVDDESAQHPFDEAIAEPNQIKLNKYIGSMQSMGSMGEIETREERKSRRKREKKEKLRLQEAAERAELALDTLEILHPETSLSTTLM